VGFCWAYTDRLIDAAIASTELVSKKVFTGPVFLSVVAFRVPAAEKNSSSENPAYFLSWSGLKLIGQRGRETEVNGVRAEVDGVGVGVGGSEGGREATKCCTAPRNTSTIFSIGNERNCSISGSVRGWFDRTF